MGLIYLAVLLSGSGVGFLAGRFLFRSFPPDRTSEIAANLPMLEEGKSALQAQLQQTELAYQMASELSQFQAGFLARTSHELRSPINSVISLHQLILNDLCEGPEEEREYLALASMAAQRMLAALDELITVSKVQHGRIDLEIQPINLQLVLDDVQRLTHLQAKNKNLRLEIAAPDPDIYVLTDPSRLRQVIVHLVDRAIAHLEDGSIRVTVEHAPAEGLAHVITTDDRPEENWAEAIDLLSSSPSSPAPLAKDAIAATLPPLEEAQSFNVQTTHTPLPSGLTLFAARALIEKMQGKLELIPNPMGDRGYALRCSIPLVELEE
jgi:signal transduction histidine kinase